MLPRTLQQQQASNECSQAQNLGSGFAFFICLSFLQEGLLPDDMMPRHNDEGFSSDEEEEDDDLPLAAKYISKNKSQDVKINKRLTGHSFKYNTVLCGYVTTFLRSRSFQQ